MDIFEEQDWLRLSSVPHADASVEATRNEEVLVVERTQVVDA